MARSKLNVTHTPGLGAKFYVSDKDGDSFEVRKLEGRSDALFACSDTTGNMIAMELTEHQLRSFIDFANTHLIDAKAN